MWKFPKSVLSMVFGVAGTLTFTSALNVAVAQEKNTEPIKIGVVQSLSGAFASIGTLGITGAKLAAEGATILGHPVELVIEDDQSNAKVGAQKARKLITQDKVVALQGMSASTIGAAVSNVASESRIPLIISGASASELTGKDCRRSTFRIRSPSLPMINSIVPYLLTNYGHRWYYVAYDYSWGHEAVAAANTILKDSKDSSVLGTDLVSVGTKDYSSVLLKIRQQKPDVVFVALGGSDMAAFIKQFGEFGLNESIALSGAVMDTSVAWQLGKSMLGVWPITFYASDSYAKPFVDLYTKKYGEIPSNEAWTDYIATRSIIQAINNAGSTDFDAVVGALENVKQDVYKPHEGYFRDFDHQMVQDVFIVKAKTNLKDGDSDWADVVAISPSESRTIESIAGTKAEIGCTFG